MEDLNKKYLIVGATGSVGSSLATQLYDSNKEVHLVGRNEEETKNQLQEERRAILEQFAKLSGREQELQRRSWADELSTLLDEVFMVMIYI